MTKISLGLRDKIRKNPDKEFRILIVVGEECDSGNLLDSIKKEWLGNILLADVKGAEITQLLLDPAVQSIEEDGRVQASN